MIKNRKIYKGEPPLVFYKMAKNYLGQRYDTRELSNITGISVSDVGRYLRQSGSPVMRIYETQYMHLGSIDYLLRQARGKKKYQKKIKRDGEGFVVEKKSLDELVETIKLITPDVLSVRISKPECDRGSQNYIGNVGYSVMISPKSRTRYREDYTIDISDVSRFINEKKKEIEKETERIKRAIERDDLDIRIETPT